MTLKEAGVIVAALIVAIWIVAPLWNNTVSKSVPSLGV